MPYNSHGLIRFLEILHFFIRQFNVDGGYMQSNIK